MNLPPIDHAAWLDQYTRMLAVLFEKNLGDFLLHALVTDLQEAWLRAFEQWRAAPERYAAIQNQWQESLLRFNETVSADQHNPLHAMDELNRLHGELDQCLTAIVEETPGLDAGDRRLLGFGVRHLVNAMAPEHWPLANQEVLATAYASNGMSFINGQQNFYADLSGSVIGLDVKTANTGDFVIGETLAASPGEVVFENDLFQLIQYYPLSRQVLPEPLLIVPPWINKYYVLDLTPQNSFVQWTVRQGHTVFMISWINPDDSRADLSLADYLERGCVQAIRLVQDITGAEQLNLAGYCIGGMLAACAGAYLAGDPERRVRSLTLFNTMLDYRDPGELGVFLSKRMLTALEGHVQVHGVLDGRIMRQAFTMLREDRMFWPYVVNNYLLGKAPAPNPVIYWNQDATNLPRRMLTEFLGDMYRDNALVELDDYRLAGRNMNLKQIDIPVYALACRTDHIIPWRSAYNSIRPLAGDTCFVLSDGGHVMGIVNPPNQRQSGFWCTNNKVTEADADMWLRGAQNIQGSWWPHWHDWLATPQSGRIGARFPGGSGVRVIESAPGRYVKNRA